MQKHKADPLHFLSLAYLRDSFEQGAMENRSVSRQEFVAIPQTERGGVNNTDSLTEAELHSLMQFFELLDRWDREVVQ